MKILNIFDHLFTNIKPLEIQKGQKGDLFSGSKEQQSLNKIGYFGNNNFYMKLYKCLKSAFDSYKVRKFFLFILFEIIFCCLVVKLLYLLL